MESHRGGVSSLGSLSGLRGFSSKHQGPRGRPRDTGSVYFRDLPDTRPRSHLSGPWFLWPHCSHLAA